MSDELRNSDWLELTVTIGDDEKVTPHIRKRDGTPLFAVSGSTPVKSEPLHKLWGTARRPARPQR
jgi:hypothetical protein